MPDTLLLAFIGACTLLAVTPGPNMALIVAVTLGRGLGGGLATIAGTTTGLALLVSVAALGMTSLMLLMAEWFDVVRWAGALYLAMLGVLQLRAFRRKRRQLAAAVAPVGSAAIGPPLPAPQQAVGKGRAIALYAQGVAVALSNPKALLFLGAFLPQFVDLARDPRPQLAVLAVLFVAILSAVDVSYTIVLARARETVSPRRLVWLDGASGAFLLAGGVALATLRRP